MFPHSPSSSFIIYFHLFIHTPFTSPSFFFRRSLQKIIPEAGRVGCSIISISGNVNNRSIPRTLSEGIQVESVAFVNPLDFFFSKYRSGGKCVLDSVCDASFSLLRNRRIHPSHLHITNVSRPFYAINVTYIRISDSIMWVQKPCIRNTALFRRPQSELNRSRCTGKY